MAQLPALAVKGPVELMEIWAFNMHQILFLRDNGVIIV